MAVMILSNVWENVIEIDIGVSSFSFLTDCVEL